MGSPVIRSYYKSSSAKQYVRDHRTLRTEPSINAVRAFGVNKALEHLPELRQRLQHVAENYLNAQQDILEIFLDRGELERLSEATVLANGKRIPGLNTTHPRQLALMHALVRFSHLAAGGVLTTTELHPYVLQALGPLYRPIQIGVSALRSHKLRTKGLLEKIPRSRRYKLTAQGY